MGLFRRKGRTSILERNQLLIGALAVLLVLGGSAGALLLSAGVFSDTYHVTAHFSDAAGLKSGDDVKVAGLDAGKVDSVEVSGGEVVVGLKVDRAVEMPKDSRAVITIETLLGKKNVTLEAGESNEPLAEGSVIPLERTITPVDILDIADTSVDLLEGSDADALETFMVEVSKITRGKRDQITTLINGFGDTAAAINTRRAELSRLIDSLRILSGTFAERDDTLVNLIDNFDVVLGNLAERTGDLEELLFATDDASHEIASLAGRNRVTITSALQGLGKALEVVDAHQVDLAASVAYLEDAVNGYQSVGYSQGTQNRWANIFVQSLGPVGADAFFGPCGALDQALDDLLGPDPRPCDERTDYGDQGQDDDDPGDDQDPRRPKSDNAAGDELLDDVKLPGDIGDLLDSVTGTTGLGSLLRERLL
jgi:phospholipid/cholesterol/gamma-HCH transport system substrate-binding protein